MPSPHFASSSRFVRRVFEFLDPQFKLDLSQVHAAQAVGQPFHVSPQLRVVGVGRGKDLRRSSDRGGWRRLAMIRAATEQAAAR